MDAIYKNVKSVCCTPETYINKLYYHKKGKKKNKGYISATKNIAQI